MRPRGFFRTAFYFFAWAVSVVAAACTALPRSPGTSGGPSLDDATAAIFRDPCGAAFDGGSRSQALDAFAEAACLHQRIEETTKTKDVMEMARKGIERTNAVLSAFSGDGPTYYLRAILIGHLAESEPLRALDLVPEIESDALLATRLAPRFDHAGPHRLLGELYLRAPEPPLSIGDIGSSVRNFRKAVEISPDFTENRLGLARALIEDGQPEEACAELGLTESGGKNAVTRSAKKLWERFCRQPEP